MKIIIDGECYVVERLPENKTYDVSTTLRKRSRLNRSIIVVENGIPAVEYIKKPLEYAATNGNVVIIFPSRSIRDRFCNAAPGWKMTQDRKYRKAHFNATDVKEVKE